MVAEGIAVVSAEANISEYETNCGFEWRKLDAPASLESNSAYAMVNEGTMEGVIKNLQMTYYKVRAFYKANRGDCYYGDWVTFDPADISFFEPTIHTYDAVSVSSSSATLIASAIRGTDDILEQGFEYCFSKSTRLGSEQWIPVTTALGDRMSVEITKLNPASEYRYRPYVKTSNGTYYGKEGVFTTLPGESGIDDVKTDVEKEVIAVYDLQGRKRPSVQPGFNIVVYSDGSREKIISRR